MTLEKFREITGGLAGASELRLAWGEAIVGIEIEGTTIYLMDDDTEGFLDQAGEGEAEDGQK